MENINIRYGESVTMPLDSGDTTAVSAVLYIGKPGELYKISKTIALTSGEGTFVLDPEDTRVPLGTYYYQVNVIDDEGGIEKYPSPDCHNCTEVAFPKFIVSEALDETEVVS
tara:strand:+ start:1296 stop:1631 length:336 start_codon:yes stop_codon:yes gene_type:complete